MCIAVSNNMKVHSKQTEHNENSKKNLEAEKQSFNWKGLEAAVKIDTILHIL